METVIDVLHREHGNTVERDVVARDVLAFVETLERRHFSSSSLGAARRRPVRPRRALQLAKRASRLPRAHLQAVVATVALAFVVEAGVRLLPLPRLARALGVPLSSSPPMGGPRRGDLSILTPREQRRVWATDAVFRRWPFGDTCLRRALVLGRVLRHQQPVLRIGVARDQDVLAHAWVETSLLSIGSEPAYQTLTHSTP